MENFFSDFESCKDFFFLPWKLFGLPSVSNLIVNSSSMIDELIVSDTDIRLDALLSSLAISFLVLHSVFVLSDCDEYSCTACFVLHEDKSKSKIANMYNSFFIVL